MFEPTQTLKLQHS